MTETEQTLLRLLEQAMKPPLIYPSPVIRDLAQHETLPCGHPRACRDSDGICGWCYDVYIERDKGINLKQKLATCAPILRNLRQVLTAIVADERGTAFKSPLATGFTDYDRTLQALIAMGELTDKEGKRSI